MEEFKQEFVCVLNIMISILLGNTLHIFVYSMHSVKFAFFNFYTMYKYPRLFIYLSDEN